MSVTAPGDLGFEGRVVLVTGGASGLGRQYSEDLARAGAHVMVNALAGDADRRHEAESFVDALNREGHTVALAFGDVGIEQEAVCTVTRTVETFGRVDALVNNAGVGVTGALQDVTTDQLRTSLEVNLLGTAWTMQAALEHMRTQGHGRIVNTGSGVGAFGAPGAFPYIAAKAAVFGMTLSAAADNADVDICINTVSPIAYSAMGTGFTRIDPALDEDRLHARHISPVVMYLAHERCSMTGQALHAAGGRVARIFTAMTGGYSSEALTATDVAEHLEQIRDASTYFALANSREQYDHIPRTPRSIS
ncbi:MAG: SDR family oxidoreductase [Nocardioides sp.]|uniref:SDR family NAD(P)-dependent oxidoreductase n=1 Tax=Nocardioides sp. TaxID=35761 RepID=UPI003266B0B5